MLKRTITFALIMLLTMGVIMTPGISEGVWAGENYDIIVESYDGFFNSIKEAMLSFKEKISIRINEYDANIYDFSKVIDEVIEQNPETYYHYGGASGSFRSYYYNQTYRIIDIYFRYRGTQHELDSLVEVRSIDEYEDVIIKALQSFDSKMLIKIHNYNGEQYNFDSTIYKVLSEVPDLDYGINGWSLVVYGSGEDKIIESYINYSFAKEKMVEMKEAVDKKAKEIISKIITSDMKDYEKELVLHDYIINNAEYNTSYYEENFIPDDEHTAYGVLIKGTGVCSSYAKAMHKLLDMVGIESYFVSGNAGGELHAWNIAKIQERYYHIDLTWDDPIMSDGSDIISHDYFNLSDNTMSIDHSWNREEYPKCTSKMYSYDNITKILSGEISLINEENSVAFKTVDQLPNNIVIIGYNAFNLDFVNNPENKDIIRNSFEYGVETNIYVKREDRWFNADGSDAEVGDIPDVSYTEDGHFYEDYLSLESNLEGKDNIIVDLEKMIVGTNISVTIEIKGEPDYPEAVKYKISEFDMIAELGEKIFIFPGKKAGDVIKVQLLNENQEPIVTKNILITENVSKPSNLKAAAISENEIQLYWDKVEEADYYYVYKASSQDGPFEPYYDDNGEPDKYYWYPDFCLEVYDIEADTTLYFKVTAVKDGIESEFSNIAYATTFDSVGSQSLYLVQESNYYNYEGDTIGKAFNTYFTDPKWTYFESIEGDHVVEFTGKCYYDSAFAEILIQFTVNLEDQSFYVNYKEKNQKFMIDSLWLGLLNSIFRN